MKLEGTTPPEVADLIKDIIQDKTVCDVGCGDGSFMEAMDKYADLVYGIEEIPEAIKLANERGFDVHAGSAWFNPLPDADVYYLWNKQAMGLFLKAQWEDTKGTFIFGHTIRPSLSKFLNEIDGEKRELPGSDWWVKIVEVK